MGKALEHIQIEAFYYVLSAERSFAVCMAITLLVGGLLEILFQTLQGSRCHSPRPALERALYGIP